MERRAKIYLILFLLIMAVGAAFWIVSALTPEETRIRRLLRYMADGFNDGRSRACVHGLADDFRDRPTELTRAQIQALVRQYSLQARDPATGETPFVVEVPDDDLVIRIDGGGTRAEAELRAIFRRRDDPDGDPEWEILARPELEKGDDGWRIQRAPRETVAGRNPFR